MLRFPIGGRNLNRIATLAVLPLIAFGIVLAMRAGGDEPVAVAEEFDPSGILVIANLVSQDLTIHNFSNARPPVTLALPGAPHEMVQLNGRLYITLDRANLLVDVDPRAPGILRTLPLAGRPHGIATDGTNLFVTLDDADEVVTIDVATFALRDHQPTGDTPHAVVVADGVLYVTDSRDNTVRRFAPGGPTVVADAGELPESIVVANGLVITGDADSNQLSAFESETLAHAGSVDVPGRPVRVLATPQHLLVSRSHDAMLEVLTLPALEHVASAPVADFPDGICPDPTGRYVGVASNGEGLATVLSAETWEPLGALSAGSGPGACLWFE